MTLCLSKTEFPLDKDTLCLHEFFLKGAEWFLYFYNFETLIYFHYNYLPLERGMNLHLNKLESPLHFTSFVKIGRVALEMILKYNQCIFAIALLSPFG